MKTGVDHQCHSKPFTGVWFWGALQAITSPPRQTTSTNGWRSLSEVCFCHRVFAEVSLVLYTMLPCYNHTPFHYASKTLNRCRPCYG